MNSTIPASRAGRRHAALLGTVLAAGLAAGLVISSRAPLRAAPPPARIALVGARIIPVAGKEIERGTVLIDSGRIAAVGTEVEIPYDAVEVDVAGKVIFPGMIDPHSARGLDVQNENLSVTPYVDVYDAIDPSRLFFEESLRDGVTSIHVIPGNRCVIGGVSRLVHPIGLTPDEMTQQPSIALKLSMYARDRMTQMATFRKTFDDLEEYLDRVAEKKYGEELEKKGGKIDVLPEEASRRGRKLITDDDLDDRHRNLARLTSGRLAAWIYCAAAMDVEPAIELARAHGFLDTSVLVLGSGAFKAVDALREAGRPVVLSPNLLYRERDPLTGEIEETFVPSVIHEAGLSFALQPDPDESLAERYLNYQAARCVRHGIPRQRALEAITIAPARMLGVADRFGSIEAGKVANLVVFSGDPLEFSSWVERVYIKGVLAYERSRDPRLRTLLGEEETEGASGAGKKAGKKAGKAVGKAEEKAEERAKEKKQPQDEPEKKKPDEKPDEKPDGTPREKPAGDGDAGGGEGVRT